MILPQMMMPVLLQSAVVPSFSLARLAKFKEICKRLQKK
jgi:hypothetical protein